MSAEMSAEKVAMANKARLGGASAKRLPACSRELSVPITFGGQQCYMELSASHH